MSLQPTLIAPFKTGLDTDLEPWLAPPDSFSILENMHIHHSVLEKRSGYAEFGQMVVTSTAINITGISNANPGVVSVADTSSLTEGQLVYIEGVAGMTEVNDLIFTVANIVLNTSFELQGIDTSLFGVYAATGTVNPVIDSTDRVMGISRYIAADNSKVVLAFNTTRANKYDGATNSFSILDGDSIMSGSDTDYIWTVNWQSSGGNNRLYFTNGKAYDGSSLDGIRFFTGTGNTTTSFTPDLNAGATRILLGGRLIFSLKQRLVVLYTFEGAPQGGAATNFPQRARWCQAQGPNNWDDITPGGGGFVDAPTGEQIISARPLQDSLIVFFTNSVWTLRPVPDPALPFRWDKINDFRACDGKMATVGYDRYVTALGVRGITATDGVETRRVDERIEDFTVDSVNVDEFGKVFCERSYSHRRWWTLFPFSDSAENSKSLIYDDDSSAFSIYNIALNSLGYGNAGFDWGLDDFTVANDRDWSLIEGPGDSTLQDYFWQDNQEIFLGGDTAGKIYQLETGGSDNTADIDTELMSAAWNPYKDQGVECQLSYIDFFVDTDKQTTATVEFYTDNNTSPYKSQRIDFLPNLDFIGSIIDVTKASPASVNVPDHGLTTGDVVYIYGVNGMTQLTEGSFTVTVVTVNTFTLDDVDSSAFTAYTTGGQIVRRRFYREKTWKRAYGGAYGYQHRIRFLSKGGDRPFRIHAFKPYFRPRGRRTVT